MMRTEGDRVPHTKIVFGDDNGVIRTAIGEVNCRSHFPFARVKKENKSKRKNSEFWNRKDFLRLGTGVASSYSWVNFGVSCNERCRVNLKAISSILMHIWYMLWTFGIFCSHFGIFCSHFGIFFPVLVCCTKKNLATLVFEWPFPIWGFFTRTVSQLGHVAMEAPSTECPENRLDHFVICGRKISTRGNSQIYISALITGLKLADKFYPRIVHVCTQGQNGRPQLEFVNLQFWCLATEEQSSRVHCCKKPN
jgi:hypothetical protein